MESLEDCIITNNKFTDSQNETRELSITEGASYLNNAKLVAINDTPVTKEVNEYSIAEKSRWIDRLKPIRLMVFSTKKDVKPIFNTTEPEPAPASEGGDLVFETEAIPELQTPPMAS